MTMNTLSYICDMWVLAVLGHCRVEINPVGYRNRCIFRPHDLGNGVLRLMPETGKRNGNGNGDGKGLRGWVILIRLAILL
jgi:hypothetical protein